MKRELILIRHIKSAWGDLSLPDFERPIKKSRATDAEKMAKTLSNLGLKPDLILCSPAKRTKQTVECFCTGLTYDYNRIQFDQRLYESSAQDYLSVIRETSAAIETLVVVGHNPSITDFANLFARPRIEEVPTTGVIWLEFDSADWELYTTTPASLHHFLTPEKPE